MSLLNWEVEKKVRRLKFKKYLITKRTEEMRSKLNADVLEFLKRLRDALGRTVGRAWFAATEGLEIWDAVVRDCLSIQITSAPIERIFSRVNNRLSKSQLTQMCEDSISAYTLSMNPRKHEVVAGLGLSRFSDAVRDVEDPAGRIVVKQIQVSNIVASALAATFKMKKSEEIKNLCPIQVRI